MENTGCKIIVSGKVQCVGFRYFTCREAERLGITGYAKNLSNGDVEVVLYGNSAKISEMLQWLNSGPDTARVDNINASKIPYVREYGFVTL